MKPFQFIVATLSLALAGVSTAQATILTFEDLNPAPASYDLMPAPYNGFTFTGWFYGPDTIYTPASGTIDLFTDYADPNDPGAYVITNNNAITSAVDFVFDGAWFSGYSGVTFELWDDGVQVATSGSLPDAPGVNPYGPIFLASGYSGLVDKVVVSGVQGYYAMDDFTFHTERTTTVPEPSTFALLLTGLSLAGFIRTRRHRPGSLGQTPVE